MRDLNNNLNFIFEQKEMLTNELQTKFVNILKMLLYVYSNTVLLIENKSALKQMCTLKVTKVSYLIQSKINFLFSFFFRREEEVKV